MVGEIVKRQGWARLFISCDYSCTFYFLVKILLVKLKNLHTSACLKLNYCTTKQTKNVKVAKMVEFIKTNTLVNFFNSILLSSLFLLRKEYLQKTLFGRNAQFPSAWGLIIKTWESVLLGGRSKNEQIQFFDSKMYLQ